MPVASLATPTPVVPKPATPAPTAPSIAITRPNSAGGLPRVLFLTQSSGFVHPVVRRESGALSVAEQALEIAARGKFDVVSTQDASTINAAKLAGFAAVVFYTTGELPMSDEGKRALLDFIKAGGGFAGIHSATDTFYNFPEYGEMIGGYLNGHPKPGLTWIKVDDTTSPATRQLGASFEIFDEAYQFRNWDPAKVHMLLRIDPRSVPAMHAPNLLGNRGNVTDTTYAVAWTKSYGQGKVFYTALGHSEAEWKDQRFLMHVVNGIASTFSQPAAAGDLGPLRDALLKYPWEWTHAPNPPDFLTFHPDGTATCPRFSWHWKITGPRSATAFDATQGSMRMPNFSAVITFDESLSSLHATTPDGKYVYSGRRLTSIPVAQATPVQAVDLFNGRDLTGWAGVKEFWSVKDGTIVGTTTGGPARDNTFLVWQGGEVGDFELTAKFKLTAANPKGFSNSGIQYRSRIVDQSYSVMSGYQLDMALGPDHYTGMLYEERGRSILATVGQKVRISGLQNSISVAGSLGNPAALLSTYNEGGWNDCRIVATGNHLQQFINGQQTVDVIDDGSGGASRGWIGLQLHKGAPMTAQFKEIRLKRLDAK